MPNKTNPKTLTFYDLKPGMLIDGHRRHWDFTSNLRVEYVAFDWAVARTVGGRAILLESKDAPFSQTESEE